MSIDANLLSPMTNITQFPKRPKHRAGTRVSTTVTPQISKAIDELLKGGLYGNTRSEVISRLLSESVVRCLVDGLIGIEDLAQ